MGEETLKRALLVAFHYPPVAFSSGLQRTLAYSQHLQQHGWQPLVLSAHPRAARGGTSDQINDIPADVVVKRAFALDSGRHLAIAGRYPDILAMPDRWVSWWFGAVFSGWTMIKRYRPEVIWTTYPIATAHLIGLTLHRLTGLPWVADFRDSMTEEGYPRNSRRRKVFRWIERKSINACSKAIFTTPGAVSMYRERYPHLPDTHWAMLPNGYNEEIFRDVEQRFEKRPPASGARPLTLVHSGVLYPQERDPRHFFKAISRLKREAKISSQRLRIVLRATGSNAFYQRMLEDLGIQDIVKLATSIPYREALSEMFSADGLLVFQAADCNHQVPAKIYEYFRARRPVFSLTDPQGDTASTLREAGIDAIVPLDDAEMIAEGLMNFLNRLNTGDYAIATESAISRSSRQYSAQTLAKIFEEVSNKPQDTGR